MDQGVQKLQAEATQNAVNSISALAEGDLDGAYTYLVDENIEYISNYGENVFTENEELAKDLVIDFIKLSGNEAIFEYKPVFNMTFGKTLEVFDEAFGLDFANGFDSLFNLSLIHI